MELPGRFATRLATIIGEVDAWAQQPSVSSSRRAERRILVRRLQHLARRARRLDSSVPRGCVHQPTRLVRGAADTVRDQWDSD